jgi:vitamin B12 transporter
MNPSQNSRVNPDDDAYRREGLFLSAEKAVREGLVLGLHANAIKSRVEYDSGSAFSGDIATDTHHSDTNTSDLTLFGRFKPLLAIESRLGITQSRFEYVDFKNGAQSSRSEGNQTSLNLSNVYRLSAGSFSFGIDATQSDYESYGSTYDRNAQGYYVGWQGVSGRLDYQLALRHDSVEAVSSTAKNEKDADTWLAGLGFQLTDQLRATTQFSTSFRAPATAEVFDTPSLKPESHEGREFGLSYQSGATLARIVRFETETSDAISYTGAGSGRNYENIGKVENQGFELSVASVFDGWRLKLSAVNQDPRNGSTNARLARRAREYASVDLTRTALGIDWAAKVIASGDRVDGANKLPGYSILNLTASKKLAPEWTGRLKVENAFDKQYQLAYGYDAVPFGVFLSVQYQPK